MPRLGRFECERDSRASERRQHRALTHGLARMPLLFAPRADAASAAAQAERARGAPRLPFIPSLVSKLQACAAFLKPVQETVDEAGLDRGVYVKVPVFINNGMVVNGDDVYIKLGTMSTLLRPKTYAPPPLPPPPL